MTSLHLVTRVGSIRKGSYNAAIALALRGLASADTRIDIPPLVELPPIYDADLQGEGFPDTATSRDTAIRPERH